MKIYLRNTKTSDWELHEGDLIKLKKELDKRNIVISSTANIGDKANIGNYANIGYKANIGDEANIGDKANIGYKANIGNYANIGYKANIGNYANIGDKANIGNYANIGYKANIGDEANIGNYANIGDYANIGNYANIGDEANIGNYANIGKLDIFTKEYIYIQLGLCSDEKGYYTMYKAVKKDLTDFYTGKYQYKVGKGDKTNEKRNQDKQCGNNSWHFSNLWNANSFGKNNKDFQIISAKIHISNILSVYDKVRVNKFSDVQLVDIKL